MRKKIIHYKRKQERKPKKKKKRQEKQKIQNKTQTNANISAITINVDELNSVVKGQISKLYEKKKPVV